MAQTVENDAAVQLERRSAEERRSEDRRKETIPVENDRRKGQRRKAQRRRQIDPTTCERDYSNDEIEFMQALDEYKRLSGRMFPTCSEILEVLFKLGYRQIEDVQDIYKPESESSEAKGESLADIEDEEESFV